MTKTKQLIGTIFDIKRYALHDGPGIRITVFFKGCPLDCWWCHNPESRAPGVVQWPSRSDPCRQETIGREVTVDEVMREIEKETVFLDESGGGVTFSGGEPLMQLDFLEALLTVCRERDFHTTLDTTGQASARNFARIIDLVDLFYYDIKLTTDEGMRTYTGTDTRFILANLETLAERGKHVVIRFPVIPGITDTEDNIQGLIALMTRLNLSEAHLLPYHRIAAAKYEWLGMENRMGETPAPSPESLAVLSERLRSSGIRVKTGG